MGKILAVDLSDGKIRVERPEDAFYRNFIGGYGIGVKYIYDNQKPGVDPLSSESILGFTTGLFNGVGIPSAGRFMVVGKSPLTGTWGDSNAGGFFGPELKKTGFDAVFIKGISEKPVYLWIHDEDFEIRDAKHIWGRDTYEAEALIKKELSGERVKVACIGPSGEKKSLISGIVTDKGRIAARSGLGAVMGSKNLKAVAVKGELKVKVFDEEKIREISRNLVKRIKEMESSLMKYAWKIIKPIIPRISKMSMSLSGFGQKIFFSLLREFGTSFITPISIVSGDSPVKNWRGTGAKDLPWDKSRKLSGEKFTTYRIRKYACSGCPIGCGAILSMEEIKETHRPEYETVAAFGSMLLIDDLKIIAKFNDICNRYGLDTISTGSTIAFAMECYEKGILTKKDLDGIDLKWGDGESALKLLNKIAHRDGIGNVLADGVRRSSERIGGNSGEVATHVHGQELPMHDPRLNPSYGASYVLDPTPARHTTGGAGFEMMSEPPLKVEVAKVERYQYGRRAETYSIFVKTAQIISCLGFCLFLSYLANLPVVELLNAVTGWNYSVNGLLETGERIQTLRHVFNVREGFKPSDFKLPDRVAGNPPLESGPTAGVTLDMETMIREYYQFMDWDVKTGRPSKEKLIKLGLMDVVNDLYP